MSVIRATLLLLLGGMLAASAPRPLLWFDGAGGDAWRFVRTVAGATAPGACEAVAIAGGRSRVIAAVRDDRFRAEVPLVEGANRLVARCLRGGAARGGAAVQRWVVRAPDRPRAEARLIHEGTRDVLDATSSRPAEGRAL